MASTDDRFAQAAKEWDLETLYADLASAKGKRLTPTEKLHLRGLLCGHSPAEIANKLGKIPKGVEADLCNTLYRYVKSLVGRENGKVDNWRNICVWLHEAGYKAQCSSVYQLTDDLPVDLVVKKANISFENNQILIDMNIRLAAKLPSESAEEVLEMCDRPPESDLN